jgi:hypothetical protein
MELISKDILSKKCHINLGPILSIYRVTFVIGIFRNFNFSYSPTYISFFALVTERLGIRFFMMLYVLLHHVALCNFHLGIIMPSGATTVYTG